MAEETAPETAPAATPEATSPAPEAPATTPAAEAAPAVDPLDNGLGFAEFLASPSSTAPDPVEEEAPAGDPPAADQEKPPAGDPPAKEEKPAEPDPKDVLEARLKETRDYATREAQRAKELEAKLAKAEKKLRGDDWDDDEPTHTATVDDVVETKVQEAKLKASITAANAIYGEEQVKAALFNEGAPFGPGGKYAADPELRRIILSAEAPAVRAMEVLEEIQFTEQWGTKPKDVEAKIRADERAKLEQTIEAEVEKRIQQRVRAKRDSNIAGLGEVRGGATPRANGKGSNVVNRPLSALGNPALSSS